MSVSDSACLRAAWRRSARHGISAFAIAGAICVAAAGGAAGATFTTIDVTGANATFATAINAGGSVTGYYSQPNHGGFVRDPDGTITTFTVKRGGDITPVGINRK